MAADAPGWNKNNADLLKQFLTSGTGELFLAQLAQSRPSLHKTVSDVNAVALQAQLVAGFEHCLGTIATLSAFVEEEKASTDSEWRSLDSPPEPHEEKPR